MQKEAFYWKNFKRAARLEVVVSLGDAREYVSDSEKAEKGDADAAYRLGEALESGRLGGLKNIKKALMFYKLAARNGNQEAAARVAQLEKQQGQNPNR